MYACKIKVYAWRPYIDATSNAMPVTLTICPILSDTVGSWPDDRDLAMQLGAKQFSLDYFDVMRKGTYCTNFIATKTALPYPLADQDSTWADTDASPNNRWNWGLFFTSQGNVTNKIYFDVKVTYYTKLKRRHGDYTHSTSGPWL